MEELLNDRANTYGPFAEHARITQELKDTLHSGLSWDICSDAQREALDMIAHKMARIVNGQPNYDDSWIDIIGYTQRALDEINEIEQFKREMAEEIMLNEELEESLERKYSEEELELEDDSKDQLSINDSILVKKDALSAIEINGIKVLISDTEMKKLEALKESEELKAESTTEEDRYESEIPEDHEDQTYIKFDESINNLTDKLADDFLSFMEAFTSKNKK